MSETLFKFLLSELRFIRLRCKKANCGGVAELPVGRLQAMTGICRCPSCGEQFLTRQGKFHRDVDSLAAFGIAIGELSSSEAFDVEFVIPDRIDK
jgi:hypothetical protein